MIIENKEIKNLEKVYRLNLINSITGIKPANLIGTRSNKGIDNVAIFSSIVHLGSNPAQIGFVMRPQIHNQSDTYKNIVTTKSYTINHITESIYKKAHLTSVKTSKEEFDITGLEKEFINPLDCPFVKASPIKIGMKLIKEIDLPNKCIFIVGEIDLISIDDSLISSEGKINLDIGSVVGISGLDSYYNLKHIESLPYVKNIDDINIK